MNPRQELQLLEQLLDELLRGIQDALQAGEILSDEFQGMLAQELDATTNRIDQLRAQIGGGGIQAPPIPLGMPSSNVAGSQYDPESGRMFVQFLGKHPNRQGQVYSYDGVPPVVAELIQSGAIPARTDGQNKWGKWWKGKVPSAGASVFTLLKQTGLPYQRLTR